MIDAKLSIDPVLPIRGIYYISQYGTSGYASASRGYLYHYFTNGISITWDPLYFDNSQLSNDDQYDVVIKSLINKSIDQHDMVIMHSTPDLWPKFWKEKYSLLQNKIVNGYCTWETSKLPIEWVSSINNCVNEVWCPSKYNEKVFKDSGVTVPIRVVPHIFLPQNLPLRKNIKIKDGLSGELIDGDNEYTFYSIGECNARKGIDDLINVFCESFNKHNKVRLILKIHHRDYSTNNKQKCKEYVNNILKNYPNHAKVICLFNNLSNKEILALHSIGDCYISLTKAEGFGLTIFEAFNYGKKIICTGYSGMLDYLGENYTGLVKYKIGKVEGMDVFSPNYTSDQNWAYPDLKHASKLMRNAYYDKNI